MNGYRAPIDRYGHQFATRVERYTEHGVIYADIVQQADDQMLRLVVGGIILSPIYDTMCDAMDAAEVILSRLEHNEILVEPMPGENPQDFYQGEMVPTGWDAADHKAMYE